MTAAAATLQRETASCSMRIRLTAREAEGYAAGDRAETSRSTPWEVRRKTGLTPHRIRLQPLGRSRPHCVCQAQPGAHGAVACLNKSSASTIHCATKLAKSLTSHARGSRSSFSLARATSSKASRKACRKWRPARRTRSSFALRKAMVFGTSRKSRWCRLLSFRSTR